MNSVSYGSRSSTIRRARERSGIGLRELARRLNVTPNAITGWEQSERLGTAQLNTIERALAALGEQLVIDTRHIVDGELPNGLERREDRVALELHRAVAKKLLDDPESVLRVVPENLGRLRHTSQGTAAKSWLDEWQELTQTKSIGRLVDVMLGTDSRSISMRQLSPFLGVLSPQERVLAIKAAQQK
jgi:transcriptional regulator with XRE-family HTH domain